MTREDWTSHARAIRVPARVLLQRLEQMARELPQRLDIVLRRLAHQPAHLRQAARSRSQVDEAGDCVPEGTCSIGYVLDDMARDDEVALAITLSNFFNKLRTHVFDRVFQFDLFRY